MYLLATTYLINLYLHMGIRVYHVYNYWQHVVMKKGLINVFIEKLFVRRAFKQEKNK